MITNVFRSIFFVLILLTSKVGLAINIHFCGGQIFEISMAWDATGCQVKSFSDQCGYEVRKSNCCNYEIVYVQNNTPQKAFEHSYDPNLLILPNGKQFFFAKEFYIKQKELPRTHFLISKNKNFIFNSALIFYG